MNKKYLACTAIGMLVVSTAFTMNEGDHAELQQDAAAVITLQTILESVKGYEDNVQALEELLVRKEAAKKPEDELISLKETIKKLKKLADEGIKHRALAQGEDFNGTAEQRREFTKQVDDYEQNVLRIYPGQDERIREMISLVTTLTHISIRKACF